MKKSGIIVKLRKGFVKFCKSCKLGWLITILVVLALTIISNDILNKIYDSTQSEDIKKQIMVFKDYTSLTNLFIPNIICRWILTIVIFMFLLMILYFRYCFEEPKAPSKREVYILGHLSMGNTQLKVSDEYLEKNNIHIEQLDLCQDMKNVGNDYAKIQNVVHMQDSLVEKFKNRISGTNKYGYMGISDTPLILRAGYIMGDETKFLVFHKERSKEFFEELADGETLVPMEIESRKIVKGSKELIVAISTTFPIVDNQLSVFQPEYKSVIKFETSQKGYDVIKSDKQIQRYVMFVLDEVRNIVRKNGITKVHMVISSSVAFTFVLGQRMSSRYDVETVIYQYDSKTDKIYPWGISLFKDNSECIVIN
nr:SAVED domain-containing protein [uncultured Anaerosporobacter sp.]